MVRRLCPAALLVPCSLRTLLRKQWRTAPRENTTATRAVDSPFVPHPRPTQNRPFRFLISSSAPAPSAVPRSAAAVHSPSCFLAPPPPLSALPRVSSIELALPRTADSVTMGPGAAKICALAEPPPSCRAVGSWAGRRAGRPGAARARGRRRARSRRRSMAALAGAVRGAVGPRAREQLGRAGGSRAARSTLVLHAGGGEEPVAGGGGAGSAARRREALPVLCVVLLLMFRGSRVLLGLVPA
jgi:hypothetical protein